MVATIPRTLPRSIVASAAIVGVLHGCGDDATRVEASGSHGSDASETGDPPATTTNESTSDGSTSGAGTDTTTGVEPVCGNGILEPGEGCDDGNVLDGDGCSASCQPTVQTAIAVGAGECTCAVLSEGRLRCWGGGEPQCHGWGPDWIFGIGAAQPPAALGDLPLPFAVLGVSLGNQHSCALTDDASVRCWGLGVEEGQLGHGDLQLESNPVRLADASEAVIGAPVEQVVVGFGVHSCAIVEGGRLRCWGGNDRGQLGYGHTENIGDDETPASAGDVEVGGTVRQVVVGGKHTCALLDGGDVRCWGWADPGPDGLGLGTGYLGYGNLDDIGDDEVPASVGPVVLGGPAIDLSAGTYHTCAVLEDASVVCWGHGGVGKLGYGNQDDIGDDEIPDDVGPVDVGEPVVGIAVGHSSSCARLARGRIKCWGGNSAGKLGYPGEEDVGDDETPADIGAVDVGGPVLQLSVGIAHTCALLPEHRIRCWGWNPDGRLGYGNTPTEDIGDDEVPAAAGDVPYE